MHLYNILEKTVDFTEGETLTSSITLLAKQCKTKICILAPDAIKLSDVGGDSPTVKGTSSKLVLSNPEAASNGSPISNGSTLKQLNTSKAELADEPAEDLPRPKFQLHYNVTIDLEWQKAGRIGGGLCNMGNTCFMNSVLQCLTYTPPLANYLLNKHKSHCQKASLAVCTACEMGDHIQRMLQASGSAVRPVFFTQRLKLIAKHFCLGRQEDAHEYLRYLVDHMWKCCVLGWEKQNNTIKLDPVSKQTTPINEIFGGYHRSQVQCLECKGTSNTYDYFMDFMLDIKQADSLTDAFRTFIKPELLTNENSYKCPKCKKKVMARKSFSVYKPPKVATIQLKRFDYNRIFGGKINKSIAYPETLNLRPYMSNKSGLPILYQLYGVLVHRGGSCNSGHYYCYVRNSNLNWFCMDDSSVSQVGLNTALNQSAYILFYVRKSEASQIKQNGVAKLMNNGTIFKSPKLQSPAKIERKADSAEKENPVRTPEQKNENGENDIRVFSVKPTTANSSNGTLANSNKLNGTVSPGNNTPKKPQSGTKVTNGAELLNVLQSTGFKVQTKTTPPPPAKPEAKSSPARESPRPRSPLKVLPKINTSSLPKKRSREDSNAEKDSKIKKLKLMIASEDELDEGMNKLSTHEPFVKKWDQRPSQPIIEPSPKKPLANYSIPKLTNPEEDNEKSLIVKKVANQESSLNTFGSKVQTWNGESNELDKAIQKEIKSSNRLTEDDLYNEEFDEGKVKKIKSDKKQIPLFNKNYHSSSNNLFDKYNKYSNKGNSYNTSKYYNNDNDNNSHPRNNFNKSNRKFGSSPYKANYTPNKFNRNKFHRR